MPKTAKEVADLKAGWLRDSCWDIETTEGFEEHEAELLAFRQEREAEWERQHAARENEIDAEADRIGARGLYRMVLALQGRIERLERAGFHLADGEQRRAYDALRGYNA